MIGYNSKTLKNHEVEIPEKFTRQLRKALKDKGIKEFTLLTNSEEFSKLRSSSHLGFVAEFILMGKTRLGSVTISSFNLGTLQGCCGVCVSSGSRVMSGFLNKGVGTILNNLRIDLATEAGYGILICTDVQGNTPQEKILRKNGWLEIFGFRNPRTGNKISIHTVELRKVR